jgi:hypothetical protein
MNGPRELACLGTTRLRRSTRVLLVMLGVTVAAVCTALPTLAGDSFTWLAVILLAGGGHDAGVELEALAATLVLVSSASTLWLGAALCAWQAGRARQNTKLPIPSVPGLELGARCLAAGSLVAGALPGALALPHAVRAWSCAQYYCDALTSAMSWLFALLVSFAIAGGALAGMLGFLGGGLASLLVSLFFGALTRRRASFGA